MLHLQLVQVALLLGVAAAVPVITPSRGNSVIPRMNPRTNQRTIPLIPARHPDSDPNDLGNLEATKSPQAYYNRSTSPGMGSTAATLSISNAAYPIVQLEDTDYVKSLECTNNVATIAFNNETAYEHALHDWQQYQQFVFSTYNPKCGSGYAAGSRSYALVNKVTAKSSAMTVEAALRFVNIETAVGTEGMMHLSIGQQQATAAATAVERLSVSGSHEFSWNEYPTNTLTTQQFGPGYQLAKTSDLDVICAGCGTEGDLTLAADVDFGFSHDGVKSASASLKGSMKGALSLGLIATDVSATIPLTNVQLATITLPGFSIDDAIAVGPQLDINAAANVKLGASGTMLAGVALQWDNVDVEVSTSGSPTTSGLDPAVQHNFTASGEISATLDLSLPITLGIGISVLDGKWNKTLGLVDTPTLSLTGETGNANGACSGVGLSADISNSLGINVLGFTTIGLESTTVQLFSTCLAGSTGSAAPATTGSAQSTPTGMPASGTLIISDRQSTPTGMPASGTLIFSDPQSTPAVTISPVATATVSSPTTTSAAAITSAPSAAAPGTTITSAPSAAISTISAAQSS